VHLEVTEQAWDGEERRAPERAAGRVECARDAIDVGGRPVALVCRDERAFHSPCSKCPCPAFVEPPAVDEVEIRLTVEFDGETLAEAIANAPPRRRRRRQAE